MKKDFVMVEQEGQRINWKAWENRNRRIFELITPLLFSGDSSVMDLGCEKSILKNLIPSDVTYYPVDYIKRSEDTIICNFNQKEFPEKRADIVVASGLLHFIQDVQWLFESVNKCCKDVFIMTYTPIEWENDIKKREEIFKWINHYSYKEILKMARDAGFILTHFEEMEIKEHAVQNCIFYFEKISSQKLKSFYQCNGCAVCSKICPEHAIKMVEDCEGFKRPYIDESKCIQCNKCIEMCPSLNYNLHSCKEIESYAVWAKDEIREKSSSGGMFYSIAKAIIDENGCVFGAAFDENSQSVVFKEIQEKNKLNQILGSKYVQCDFSVVYERVKELLSTSDKKVLVCACPCQVTALKKYLGREYSNLYTVDFICGGVPSPLLLKKYLEEYGNTFSDISFRTKDHGWNPTHIQLKTKDYTIDRSIDVDAYEKYFHSFIGQRKSCYECLYADLLHESDITLGDFWGIQNYKINWNDGKGTSIVLLNTEKGRMLFYSLENELKRIEKVSWKYTGTNRLSLRLATRKQSINNRAYLYERLENGDDFSSAVNVSLTNKHEICLVSNWSGYNYGAQLTQYALYSVLKKMGYSVLMVERPKMDFEGGNADTAFLFHYNPYPKYDICNRYDSIEDMREINDFADVFIVGSDQLWNHLFQEKELFSLGIIANDKKKIAYATSFGCFPHNWPEKEIPEEKYYLSQFDGISVREKNGIRILGDTFGIDSTNVLDPVFLCEKEWYKELISKSNVKKDSKFLCSFFLDNNDEKDITSQILCDSFKIDNVLLGDATKRYEQFFIEDMLYYFANCEFVVTDSFHGMCLALIFNKQFIVFNNDKRGNDRFDSLLSELSLKDRMIENRDGIGYCLNTEINYSVVNAYFESGRTKSYEWLLNQLKKPKEDNSYVEYDIISKKLHSLYSDQKKNYCEYIHNKDLSSKQTIDICNSLGGQIEGIRQQINKGFEAEYEVISRVSQESIETCNNLGGQIEGINQRINNSDMVISKISQQSIDMCNDLGRQIEELRQKNIDYEEKINVIQRELVSANNEIDRLNQKLINKICNFFQK